MTRLPPDVLKVLESAASHPEGLAPLLEGHLESVAALYQLRPDQVERVRDCLATVGLDLRTEVLTLKRASRPVVSPLPRTSCDADTLLHRVLEVSDGVEVLLRAPIENAAVLLEAHPFVVEEARARFTLRRSTTNEHPVFKHPAPRESAPRSQS